MCCGGNPVTVAEVGGGEERGCRRGARGVRREGDARSCSAAFCVFTPISSPSAVPARYAPPSFFPHACLQVILMVKSPCPGDSFFVKGKKKKFYSSNVLTWGSTFLTKD